MATPSIEHLRLRALALIETLAETRSLHEASRRLNTSQPALTVMLRDVEETLGARLFDRSRRGLAPTPMGEYAIQQARLLLADLRRVQSEFAAGQHGQSLLRVGALQLLMLELVPQALIRLRKVRPALRVEFEEGSAGNLLQGLASGSLDLVIGRTLPDFAREKDFEFSTLLTQSFCIIAGSHHPLASRRKPSWQDVQAADWIEPPPNTVLRDYFVEAFLRQGRQPPRALYQSASFYSCVGILQTSDCLMMVPHEVGRHFSRRTDIRILQIAVGESAVPFSIVKRRSRAHASGLAAFEKALRDVVLSRR